MAVSFLLDDSSQDGYETGHKSLDDILTVSVGDSQDNLHIYYKIVGPSHAPAVVLIHGLGCSLEFWCHVLRDRHLIRRNLFLAMDLPGFGLSSKPKTFDYSMEHQAEAVASILKKHAIRPKTIVGFSMGGPIAIHLSKLAGAEQLILVEPTITENDLIITPTLAATPGLVLDLLKLITFVYPWYFARLLIKRRDGQSIKIINRALRRVPGRVMSQSARQLVRAAKDPKTYQSFKEFPGQKAVILGQHLAEDPNYNPPDDMFEHASCYVVPGAGHSVMLDNPDFFNEILTATIERGCFRMMVS